MRRIGMVIAAALLSGCNPLSVLPREVDRRPALPPPEPFPLAVEEVIPRLEEVGLTCRFAPDSDIPGGWNCTLGDPVTGISMAVNISSDETGPIEHASAYAQFAESEQAELEPAALDAAAAEAFTELVIDPILPEDARPPFEVLHAVIADNFQMAVGDGFHLVFHRNMISRTMLIQYSTQE